jgi:hypothetical protein
LENLAILIQKRAKQPASELKIEKHSDFSEIKKWDEKLSDAYEPFNVRAERVYNSI